MFRASPAGLWNAPHARGVIRALMLAAIVVLSLLPSIASAQPLLTLEKTIPLPAIGAGDFDHFAVDLRRHKLFLAAEAHGTIETFDLRTGAHLQSARGVVMPHAFALVPDRDELFVADGGDGAVKVFDATTLHRIARIPLAADPDGGVYDPATRLFYVGNGGRAAHQDHSYVSVISVDRRAVVGRIRVPGTTIKGMVIDHRRGRLYVSVRDRSVVEVIDLRRRAVVATYSSPYLHANAPIGVDLAAQRLFVPGRKPNTLVVLRARDGATLQHLPTVATADDLTVDTLHRRLYVSGSSGLDVYTENPAGRYALAEHLDTLGGKTSFYVPSQERFYVAHSRTAAPSSGLQIYRVNP
jgi:YVTN family beta-propeller protein